MRPIYSMMLTLALASCSVPLETHPGKPLPVTRFATGGSSYFAYSQLRQAERLVIRDQTAWATAWASLFPPFAPIPAPPPVDFTKDMVVLAALGERSTGGFSITIDSALATASSATVFVGTSSPGARCVTTQAFTQPVDIARLPRRDAVEFEDVPTIDACQ